MPRDLPRYTGYTGLLLSAFQEAAGEFARDVITWMEGDGHPVTIEEVIVLGDPPYTAVNVANAVAVVSAVEVGGNPIDVFSGVVDGVLKVGNLVTGSTYRLKVLVML